MVTHMKTTIDIADPLLEAAKAAARNERTTLRALVEESLRRTLTERKSRPPFKLRDASFDGDGLQPGLQDGDWGRIRDMIYEGRGS